MKIHDLPDHSKIWIYQSNRPFNELELKWLNEKLEGFAANWKAHEKPLNAGYDIPYKQVILLAVDESVEHASGCSIDTSVHLIRDIESHLKVQLFARLDIAILLDGNFQVLNRSELLEHFHRNEVNEDTLMFDNTVLTLGDWRNAWIKPIKDSWAARWIPVLNKTT